ARDLAPGMLAIPAQIIDYTWGRAHTFYDTEPVAHAEFTHPYAESLRLELIAAAERAGVDVQPGGTYGATQGPRVGAGAGREPPGSGSSPMRALPSSSIAPRAGAAPRSRRSCRPMPRRAWRTPAGCSARS